MSVASDAPILVRLPNWLGDLVLAFPVLQAAASGPAVFVGPEPFRALLAPRFPSATYVPISRARRWDPARDLRALRPGRALLLTESLSSAVLAWLAGVPERIGYAAEGRRLLLTRPVARRGAPRSLPRGREYAVLAEAAGLGPAVGPPRLSVLPDEARLARNLLTAAGLVGAAYAVLAPGASYGPAKQWGPERFARVAEELRRRRGLRAVLVGAAGDRAAAREVREHAVRDMDLVDLTGRTELPELVGVLAGAAIAVTNDSGVMHLAAALGRPTVAVFGSTSPVWTSDASSWVANVYAAYPCSPCYRRTCPIGYGCLRSIPAEEGVRAAERLLS